MYINTKKTKIIELFDNGDNTIMGALIFETSTPRICTEDNKWLDKGDSEITLRITKAERIANS